MVDTPTPIHTSISTPIPTPTVVEEEVYIYIDASYYIFYRFYAMIQWWKVAKKDDPLGIPIENPEFVEKFKSTFITKIKDIPKKCGINTKMTKVHMYAGRDCPRKDIWRCEIFPDYKGTRNYDEFLGGPFFEMVYKEKLFEQAGIIQTYYHPHLEADDCIALSIKQLHREKPDTQVYIIASDHDYLQLVSPQLHIMNLQFKVLAESKTGSYDKNKNLFIKIVMGDSSDNIPSIFPRCGFITAKKCYDKPEFYKNKMTVDSEKLFIRNNQIINFECIPAEYTKQFLHS
jgi:5'-3' exonuclease